MYDEHVTIRTIIKQVGKHAYETTTWRNGSIVSTVPTDPSQVRTEKSYLWQPGKPKTQAKGVV